jgi:hypothetical protein
MFIAAGRGGVPVPQSLLAVSAPASGLREVMLDLRQNLFRCLLGVAIIAGALPYSIAPAILAVGPCRRRRRVRR